MYDVDQGTLRTSLVGSSTAVFTDDTISKILALTATVTNPSITVQQVSADSSGNVTVPGGTEVVFIASSDTTQTTITPPKDAPVVVFQGKGGVIATINDGPTTVPAHAPGVVDRVVVGSSGNDKIVIGDSKNSLVVLGTGSSTVVAGAGDDTITAGLGNSTISGGTGHAIVTLKGNATDYQVTISNGHAIVTDNASHVTDITKIQFVQLDSGAALVFAKDAQQAAITTLYQTTFGRTADAGGLQYWFDRANAGDSLTKIATDFTLLDAFKSQAALSNNDFITGLYQHTFARAPEAAGLEYWASALQNGASRGDVIANFASIASHVIDGTQFQGATVVGSVSIIDNII